MNLIREMKAILFVSIVHFLLFLKNAPFALERSMDCRVPTIWLAQILNACSSVNMHFRLLESPSQMIPLRALHIQQFLGPPSLLRLVIVEGVGHMFSSQCMCVRT